MPVLEYLLNPTSITLLIGGILTSFFGFLAGVSKAEITPKWIAWGSFIAGLVVIGGGFFSGYQDQISALSMQEKQEDVIEKSEKISMLSQTIADITSQNSKEISELSQKLAKISLENSELAKKNAHLITGGDGYCYLVPEIFGPYMNQPRLLLINRGEYPLYEIVFHIDDTQKHLDAIGLPKKSRKAIKPTDYSQIIEVGVLGAGMGKHYSLPLVHFTPNDIKKIYSIFFSARNGTWNQSLIFERVNNNWEWELSVFRLSPDPDDILKEERTKNFPR